MNELTTCQNHRHLAIDSHIQGLQESFAHTNQFISLPQVKPIVLPKENKEEEEEEVILICSSSLTDDKSTTTLSSNKSMVLASENPNIQLSEEINNLITSLKWFKAPSNITCFLLSTGYHTISRNGENSSRYWN